MKVRELTNEQIAEIFNSRDSDFVSLENLEIERWDYGSIEVNIKDDCQDMQLVFSEDGAIYLLCLDNGEIYHDVLNELKKLKEFNVEPFS